MPQHHRAPHRQHQHQQQQRQRRGSTGFASALVCVLVFSLVPRAEADQRDPAAAEALFRHARQLVKDQNIEAACPVFAESYRLDPVVGTLLNWADCEERRHHLVDAWQMFGKARDALLAKNDSDEDRLRYTKERLAAIEHRLGKVTITLRAAAPSEAKVVRDGVELTRASFGTPLPVDPGAHACVVSAPGRQQRRYDFTIKEGESKTLDLDVGEPLPMPALPHGHEAPPENHSSRRTWGFVTGGVGVAAIAVGTVTAVMVANEASTVKEHCTPGCDSEGYDAAQRGRVPSVVSPIAFAVGAVGLGVGAYLVLSSRASSSPSSSTRVTFSPSFFTIERTF